MKVLYGIAMAGAAMLLGCFAAGVATAKEPAAMVLDVTGDTKPALEPFSEISSGEKIDLGKDGQLSFSHYAKCQNVVVEGGVLQVEAKDYKLTGGKVVDVQQSPCPGNVKLSGAGEIGGVVMRGAKASELQVGDRPSFKLDGKIADLKSVKVIKGRTVIYEGALTGDVFTWPKEQKPLKVAKGYEMHLMHADGTHNVKQFDVVKKPAAKQVVLKVE